MRKWIPGIVMSPICSVCILRIRYPWPKPRNWPKLPVRHFNGVEMDGYKVAAYVPDDRLLIETDSPYMTPVPFRGKRCDSSYIPYTAEVLAGVRGVSAQDILDLTRRNADTLFRLEL